MTAIDNRPDVDYCARCAAYVHADHDHEQKAA